MALQLADSSRSESFTRRWPIGAELMPGGGVHFRVWAPRRGRVDVALFDGQSETIAERIPLRRESDGYHWGVCSSAEAGALYGFYLDGEDRVYPDPMSRFQPRGPHGPSQVVDPSSFAWTDQNWRGIKLRGQVIYEMHIGTFTGEGTWRAAQDQLEELHSLGITVIEVMPVADFPGRFGWGYDGVNLFAPTRLYGAPDDFRAFVDRAHQLKMGVILDVVYNHIGPDGNYLPAFAEDYFTDRYETDWGRAINFDGDNSGPVREYYEANAAYWIDEFHLDGLRLDATQNIYDASDDHILAAVTRAVRNAAGGRSTIIVAENESQEMRLVHPLEKGGYGIDGVWNDDLHHSLTVILSGHNEAYYTDYLGKPQELISAAKYGFLYQGQWYTWQKQRRGTPTRGLSPETFITFIQNHDQVSNSGLALRCHQLTSPGRWRALTAYWLLMPGTPMFFQGQEFAANSPFHFFADHVPELAEKVREGRKEFMRQFRSVAIPEMQARLPDPADPETFRRCKLDLAEREKHAEAYALHRDLLRLRREDPAFGAHGPQHFDGAVLGEEALVLRFFGEDVAGADDRLLVLNYGRDLNYSPAPEPLLAPPAGKQWDILWSSEDPKYGGGGTSPLDSEENWRLPGQAAVVLRPIDPEQRPK
jgi:maltooligosyltrehalose trehalohydrolase